MNPIRLQQAINNPALGNMKNMINTIRSARDPVGAMNQMAANNPQMKEVMDMVNGKNPKDVFYQKCDEYGINPDVVLGMLR